MRLALRTARALVLGLAIGLLLAVVAPYALGGRPLVVLSGSMEPTFATGDLVASVYIRADEARPGDIVSFNAPETRKLTEHRVRRVRRQRGQLVFTTKGDANNGTETWAVPPGRRLGRAAYVLPKLGFVVAALRGPAGRVALIAALGGLLVLELWAIWGPGQGRKPEAESARA